MPIYSSDDRFNDDVHNMGGAFGLLDVVDYPSFMIAYECHAAGARRCGRGDWRGGVGGTASRTTNRGCSPGGEQQRRQPYWQQGSIRPDYARVTCPTMIVAGWADGYRNNTFRTVEAFEEAGSAVEAADRPMESHGHREVAAGTLGGPDRGDGALVRPLAAR